MRRGAKRSLAESCLWHKQRSDEMNGLASCVSELLRYWWVSLIVRSAALNSVRNDECEDLVSKAGLYAEGMQNGSGGLPCFCQLVPYRNVHVCTHTQAETFLFCL